ncbi:hypothetical protein MVES1_002369 [Malassezia vespertilionis]|uniref:Kap123p n=1 Tax=Malassezia vespertilionis TaxID=2020962 RepID=A0A2N1JBF0_9BASI|nr:uncharacterized protein MVES1_002369 [Malassezia vespertilionis]PKI83879.1 Kap123p [Malassezia vespertilionis]WFD07013.1 hypothetical protein MVES1_002369 [Malassezia vespertilionis]
MDTVYVQELHGLLQQANVPDTAAVKSATEALQTRYLKDSKAVPSLFEITATSPELPVRQLAGVELRKKLAKNTKAWTKQNVAVRDGIKARLLELITEEQSALLRNGLARIIAEIARKELPMNGWPALLPWLFDSAESPNAAQRQISVLVLFIVLETFVDGSEALKANLPRIMALFSKSLQDPESLDVRVTTVRALGKVAENLDADDQADLAAMQSAMPQIMHVLQQSFDVGNSEGVRQILDVFENLSMLETPLISSHLAELIALFVRNGANREHEEDLRLMCLNSLIWTIQYKRSRVQSLGLAKPLLEQLMPIATEEESDDVEEDTPARLALRVIDQLATELPPSHVFPPLLEQIQLYASNSDPMHRKAAMMAFGVSVEGCSEYIRPHMNELWPFVENGMRDADPIVQKASCVTLGCLCEMLDEECAAKSSVFLPLIMELLNAPATQRSATTALDALLEVMGDDIAQYLSAIMERLTGLLETAPLSVKATITGAIGSAAHAAKDGFVPYFVPLMQRIQPFLYLVEEGEEMDLRGIATDTVGTFAEAVGKEHFSPYLPEMMKLAVESLEMDKPRIRECAFIFFAVMARVYGEDFAPYLDHVVPKMTASFEQSEHDPLPGAPGDGTMPGFGIPSNDDGDDEFLDLEEFSDSFLNVSTAIAVEKEVAADSLGELFKHTKAAFLPYVPASMEQLLLLTSHFYQGIRKSAIASLFIYVVTLYELSSPPKWDAGAAPTVPLNAEVRKVVEVVMPNVMEAWEAEDDRTAAIEICQSLASALNKCGPALIAPDWLESTCTYTHMILEKKSPAQLDPEEPEAQDEMEASEYESVLISAATDLVGAMANVLGADFTGPMHQFLPQIIKYYAPGRSQSDRATAIGSLGEIVVGMKSAITPFTQDILATLSRSLMDEEPSVRSNSAFAAGVLIEHSTIDLSPHYSSLLAALQSYFSKEEDEPEEIKTTRDNACGCLARMIIKNAEAMPLDQALPVLFSCLPLDNDYAEWAPILFCLIHLIQADNSVALQYFDTIMQLFRHVLASEEDVLGGMLRGQLCAFLAQLKSTQYAGKVAQHDLDAFLV